MLSGMQRFAVLSVDKVVFLLGILTLGCGVSGSTCTTRRCLAEMLLKKALLTQPQSDNCTKVISVPFIEYQTLSVDTKNLRLIIRMQATIMWRDPEFVWDTSVYPYDEAVLPVKKIWTPEFHVTNSIVNSMKHGSSDLLVYSNGTLKHGIIVNAEVNCEVNMFNYPFAADTCPVAIQTWKTDGCGTELELDELKVIDGSHGDWETVTASFEKQADDRNYIWVELSIKSVNPFISLMLPSILLVLADMISHALPLGGGERSSFKVTLVLSFTVFLNILNDQLPGDSHCSPVIRIHFCICLIMLVVSMLESLLLIRVAKDGGLLLCCCSKAPATDKNEDEDIQPDITVIQLNASEENQVLRKVAKFLDRVDTKEKEGERHEEFANKLDKIFTWFYVIFGTAYFCTMITVMAKYRCIVNHFDFWY